MSSQSTSDTTTEKPFQTLPWYHEDLTKETAEEILLFDNVEGEFLLRDGAQEGKVYYVSAKGQDAVHHFKLVKGANYFEFESLLFDSADDFVVYIENQAELPSWSWNGSEYIQGEVVTLKYPYTNDDQDDGVFYENVAPISSPVDVMPPVDVRTPVDAINKSFASTSLPTKSGYITKQGGFVKSWKKRWFTCIDDELSYFVNEDAEKPIFTINLSECVRCYKDRELGKENGFCLKSKSRLWKFSTETPNERDEWVTLLCWKLRQNSVRNAAAINNKFSPTGVR